MTTPLGNLGIAALALIGKFPAEEQNANLHRRNERGMIDLPSYGPESQAGPKPFTRTLESLASLDAVSG
jgi:hypothetical protein